MPIITGKHDEEASHRTNQSPNTLRPVLALTKQRSRDLVPIPQLPRSVQFRHSTIPLYKIITRRGTGEKESMPRRPV